MSRVMAGSLFCTHFLDIFHCHSAVQLWPSDHNQLEVPKQITNHRRDGGLRSSSSTTGQARQTLSQCSHSTTGSNNRERWANQEGCRFRIDWCVSAYVLIANKFFAKRPQGLKMTAIHEDSVRETYGMANVGRWASWESNCDGNQ